MSLRSKWAAGKVAYASFVYLDRLEAYATLKRFFRPALLRRLPDSTRINPDRGASLPPVRLGPPRRNLRRHHHYMRDGTLRAQAVVFLRLRRALSIPILNPGQPPEHDRHDGDE
jgi:hypothetical protein